MQQMKRRDRKTRPAVFRRAGCTFETLRADKHHKFAQFSLKSIIFNTRSGRRSVSYVSFARQKREQTI